MRQLPPLQRAKSAALSPRSWLSALILSGIFLLPRSAAADTVVGGGIDWVLPTDRDLADNGYGFNLRIGERLDGKIVVLTGELAGAYASFGGPAAPTALLGTVGGRVGIGLGLRPSLFAHVGVSSMSWNEVPGLDEDSSELGFGYDFGASLEFTLLPLLDIGAELAYVNVKAPLDDRFGWIRAGLAGALVF